MMVQAFHRSNIAGAGTIMKKLVVLSVFVLTVLGSISGPAIAADRGIPGWFGPQDPSPPWAPPG
jgi:hypothetical protein